MALKLRHAELKEANEFVTRLHRHHKRCVGHRFSLAVESALVLVGVCIVGRPVARGLDYRTTLEVLRLCTDGTSNACSFLYGAAARAGKALGYAKIGTYILISESGGSLVASGWTRGHETAGGSWNAGKRKGRREDQPQEPKVYWYKELEARVLP